MTTSLANQTLGDLSDEENIRQAEYELHRATDATALAMWASRWGEACIIGLRIEGGGSLREEIRDLEDELLTIETKLADVSLAAEALIKVLDNDEAHSEILDNAIAALENAL